MTLENPLCFLNDIELRRCRGHYAEELTAQGLAPSKVHEKIAERIFRDPVPIPVIGECFGIYIKPFWRNHRPAPKSLPPARLSWPPYGAHY